MTFIHELIQIYHRYSISLDSEYANVLKPPCTGKTVKGCGAWLSRHSLFWQWRWQRWPASWVNPLVSPDWNMSTFTVWIARKWILVIPLTSPAVPPAGWPLWPLVKYFHSSWIDCPKVCFRYPWCHVDIATRSMRLHLGNSMFVVLLF